MWNVQSAGPLEASSLAACDDPAGAYAAGGASPARQGAGAPRAEENSSMKWSSVLKLLAHPSLLPLALSAFISVAGPGGVAEIGRHGGVIPSVVVVEDGPGAPPSQPIVFVLRDVTAVRPGETTPDTGNVFETPGAPNDPAGAADEAARTFPPMADDGVAEPQPAREIEADPPASDEPPDGTGADEEEPANEVPGE